MFYLLKHTQIMYIIIFIIIGIVSIIVTNPLLVLISIYKCNYKIITVLIRQREIVLKKSLYKSSYTILSIFYLFKNV